ncbi:MAG TPA: DinB family protein [Terriglobales bacterium]|nr:DinB family protein [Terriglobales bacterium]
MPKDQQQSLREHVLYLLRGGGAHLDFDAAVADLSPELRGAKPLNIPHTAWRLLEHMRLAQWDILDFCVNPNYQEMTFPDDYWPKADAPATDEEWKRSIEQFRLDLDKLERLVSSPKTDLWPKSPGATDRHTCVRHFWWPIIMLTTLAN